MDNFQNWLRSAWLLQRALNCLVKSQVLFEEHFTW